MTIRVAIMGFGRIGRNVFRAIYGRDDIQVVAINDIADPKAMEYLLRHDSLHGTFPEAARIVDGYLYAKGQRIRILHHREPGQVPWYDHGVDVVVEATGRYQTREDLRGHLEAGADRVILASPPRDEIDAVHVRGLSGSIEREHRIISCGSSTANCLLLMLALLDKAFGVESAFFTSVHAYTGEQSLIDTYHGDLRLSRAAVENIVPVGTGTVQLVNLVLPHLAGRVGGGKLNVPVSDVSCADLVTVHRQKVDPHHVNEVFRSAAASIHAGLVEFTEEPIVSSDVAGSRASCVFDSLATQAVTTPAGDATMIKSIGWYEQGGGLSYRIVETIAEIAAGSKRQR